MNLAYWNSQNPEISECRNLEIHNQRIRNPKSTPQNPKTVMYKHFNINKINGEQQAEVQ
jgi:hypothetical protein